MRKKIVAFLDFSSKALGVNNRKLFGSYEGFGCRDSFVHELRVCEQLEDLGEHYVTLQLTVYSQTDERKKMQA
jgi:hypothetical protein